MEITEPLSLVSFEDKLANLSRKRTCVARVDRVDPSMAKDGMLENFMAKVKTVITKCRFKREKKPSTSEIGTPFRAKIHRISSSLGAMFHRRSQLPESHDLHSGSPQDLAVLNDHKWWANYMSSVVNTEDSFSRAFIKIASLSYSSPATILRSQEHTKSRSCNISLPNQEFRNESLALPHQEGAITNIEGADTTEAMVTSSALMMARRRYASTFDGRALSHKERTISCQGCTSSASHAARSSLEYVYMKDCFQLIKTMKLENHEYLLMIDELLVALECMQAKYVSLQKYAKTLEFQVDTLKMHSFL